MEGSVGDERRHLDGGLQLQSSDSEGEDASGPRPRRLWTRIWRSTAPGGLADYRTTLPTHSIDKSNKVGCTIDHLSDKNYDLHRRRHDMRSRIVLCESQRCQAQLDTSDDGDVSPLTKCPCRYKFKLCLSTSVCEVFQQGHHIMDINDPLTPVKRKLTEEMKVYITECLATGEKTTATRLYTVLDTLIDNDEMAGPAPWLSQVTDFVKNLRRKNPKDSMAPMIELCDSRLYDQLDIATLPARDMVILCDSQVESTPGASGRVSHLGDGSKTYTLRVGMTCLQMIHNYIAVQDRDDCTTILHVDSTHSMVINGYVVFAFGYSDQCGHFFPMVYFCTSHKRAIDIGWCIRYIKRVCEESCGVQFSPQFVMMDADEAQFNACVTELPHATIIMCWFHVTKNVWKYSKDLRVGDSETRTIFADLYDMHYAAEAEFSSVKAHVVAKWRRYPLGSPARKLTGHIVKIWINSHRFWRWQAFHTPAGYAATNNPLEQYHRTVKLQCPGGPAIPSELIKNLDGARIAFLNCESEFTTLATASERLMRLYRLMYKRGCLSVHPIPQVGSVAADLYRVKQSPLRLTAAENNWLPTLFDQSIQGECRQRVCPLEVGSWTHGASPARVRTIASTQCVAMSSVHVFTVA